MDYFLGQIIQDQGVGAKKFAPEAIELLQSYDWTGNIRELRNVVERLVILGGNEIDTNDVEMFAVK